MKNFALSLAVVAFAVGPSQDQEQEPSVETMPPVVVKTEPQAGSTDVDPELKEIRVTFSKDMLDGSWSWSTSWKDSTPEITGKPKYLKDKRTCVLPVKMEPGKTYGFWLNSQRFTNFKDQDRRLAVPYLLVFQTKEKNQKKKKGE